MIISPQRNTIQKDITQLKLRNTPIERTSSHKFLGLHIDEHLTWKHHISRHNRKIAHALFTFKQAKHSLPQEALKTLYFSLIHPHILYGNIAWGGTSPSTLQKTQKLIKQAIRIIHNAKFNSHTEPLMKKSQILTLNDLHEQQIAIFMFDYHHRKLPPSFNNLFPLNAHTKSRTTRHTALFHTPTPRTKFAESLPKFHFPKVANKYNSLILSCKSHSSIKHTIKTQIITTYKSTVTCSNNRCPDCQHR